jgi:hypothetical protein
VFAFAACGLAGFGMAVVRVFKGCIMLISTCVVL